MKKSAYFFLTLLAGSLSMNTYGEAEPLQPGGTVTMMKQSGFDLSTPNSKAWDKAQEYSMNLNLAPPVHASVGLRYDPNTPAMPVFIQAANDGDILYLRLRWQDATQDISTARQAFSDAAAI